MSFTRTQAKAALWEFLKKYSSYTDIRIKELYKKLVEGMDAIDSLS